MLARDVKAELKDEDIVGVDLPELDITSFHQTLECVKANKPEVVINCAAYTAVDACEANRDTAFKVNGEGPKNLAIACEKTGSELVHISTDYVFDGTKKAPYIEVDRTAPINMYGWSKYYGEQAIASHMAHYYILRTQWLYGLGGGNFVKTIMRLGKEQDFVNVVDDQFGNPTYAVDLAGLIARIIKTGQYGIYHATNNAGISWCQFAEDIFEMAGIPAEIRPVSSEQMPRPAARPKYSVLENLALKMAGFEPLRGYKDALAEYLACQSKA